MKHPYKVGYRVKALWLDKIGTCLVVAAVTATSVDPDRRAAPYGITLTHQDKMINVWGSTCGFAPTAPTFTNTSHQ